MFVLSRQGRAVLPIVEAALAPLWPAMSLAPCSLDSNAVIERIAVVFTALGLIYGVLTTASVLGGARTDVRDSEGVRAALARSNTVLPRWTDRIVFDVFMGWRIWRLVLDRDRGAQLALPLTWLAGSSGLSAHLLRRS